MSRRILVLPGVALIVAAVYWVSRDSMVSAPAGPKPARAARAEQPRAPAVRRVIETVRTATAPELAKSPREQPEAAEDEEQAAEEPHKPQTFDEVQAQVKAQQAKLQAQFEQRFSSQAIDSAWRRTAEARLNDALASVEANPDHMKLISVECHSDICKSTFTHDTPRPKPEFLMQFLQKASVALENHFAYADGQTTMYSLRRDDTLPQQE